MTEQVNHSPEAGCPGTPPSRRSRIPRSAAAAFLCCFLACYCAHLFAFTNIIPNADGLSRVYDAQQMTISGRWFLHFASMFHGYLQAPALIGFFAALFLSLSSALCVRLLRIRSAALSGLAGVLMAVFPPVAFTFLFQFTASAYCFGILLAVLSVWLTARDRRLLLPAAALLACAVGTYQAYLAVAASLSLISVLLFVLEGESDLKGALRYGLRHLLLLALGLLLYYVTLRVFLWAKDLTLVDYKGISGTGGADMLRQALASVGPAYLGFAGHFLQAGGFTPYNTPFAVGVNLGVLLVGGAALVCVLRRAGLTRSPGKLVLALLLTALLPLALNLSVLMGESRQVMRYSLVFAYVLVLALADRAAVLSPEEEKGEKRPGVRLGKCLPAAALCVSVLMGMFSFYVDNLVYTASETAHRATESFATRLVERVESTPGYRSGMQVVVIGAFPRDVYPCGVEAFVMAEVPSPSVLSLNKHVYYYLNDWLNVPWEEPDEQTLRAVSDSELFQAMPLYPDDGSVVIADGRVIVKLAERYRPKQPYEIQYENRR